MEGNIINSMIDGGTEAEAERKLPAEENDSGAGTPAVSKKRGRPRKIDGGVVDGSRKRSRGRPRRSEGECRPFYLLGCNDIESVRGLFDPRFALVHTGEDAVEKLTSLARTDSETVCVLSATGSVSSVILHRPGLQSGTLSFEGRFEILTLNGIIAGGEDRVGVESKLNTLSISLANNEGHVFGGTITGPLIAGSPIQLVLAALHQYDGKTLGKHSAKAYAAAAARGSEHNVQRAEGEVNCSTPTSVLSEPADGDADNVTTDNVKMTNTQNPLKRRPALASDSVFCPFSVTTGEAADDLSAGNNIKEANSQNDDGIEPLLDSSILANIDDSTIEGNNVPANNEPETVFPRKPISDGPDINVSTNSTAADGIPADEENVNVTASMDDHAKNCSEPRKPVLDSSGNTTSINIISSGEADDVPVEEENIETNAAMDRTNTNGEPQADGGIVEEQSEHKNSAEHNTSREETEGKANVVDSMVDSASPCNAMPNSLE